MSGPQADAVEVHAQRRSSRPSRSREHQRDAGALPPTPLPARAEEAHHQDDDQGLEERPGELADRLLDHVRLERDLAAMSIPAGSSALIRPSSACRARARESRTLPPRPSQPPSPTAGMPVMPHGERRAGPRSPGGPRRCRRCGRPGRRPGRAPSAPSPRCRTALHPDVDAGRWGCPRSRRA